MAEVKLIRPNSISISGDKGRDIELDIAKAKWIGFLNVGDAFLANEEGWWIVGSEDGAIAISVNCPSVDAVMRKGSLAQAADKIPELIRIDYAELPKSFCGTRSATGVLRLSETEVQALRSGGTTIRVSSVREFPTLP